MIKNTEKTRRLLPTNFVSVFDHFVELTLEGLINISNISILRGLSIIVYRNSKKRSCVRKNKPTSLALKFSTV